MPSLLISCSEETTRLELRPLLRRCTRGEGAAWDRLLGEVRRETLERCRGRYRLAPEDAEDVAQVVQLRVAQRLEQLRDAAAFPLWVRRLIHHAAVDLIRSRRTGLSLDDPDFPCQEAPELSVEGDFDQVLLRADLGRAMSRLPTHYREPIELHLLRGLPQDEVSQRLGRPRSTVASQIDRGLRRLERSLSGLAG